MQYTWYHRRISQTQHARRNTQDKGYNIIWKTNIVWSEIPYLRSKIPKQYSSAWTAHSDYEPWPHHIFTPPRSITFYISSATPNTQNMSYGRQPCMTLIYRSSGECLIHAWNALTVVHLRVEAGVLWLVRSIDIFRTVTPHLGSEPLGICVGYYSYRTEY